MNAAERHRRAMAIFDALCDLPQEHRATALDEQCADDAELRRKVESMLHRDGEADPFVAAAESGRMIAEFAAEDDVHISGGDEIPQQIGPYRISRKIGEGGMGIIYEAQQESPRRRVALKVLRPGMIDRGMLKRFQHEAHVLGQLQHPGIAHIHEAGIADLPQGRQPYFVMEFIDGERLDRYADSHELDTKQRLELIARVCDAVQHAHQKGVIHRDLKPSNVLVVNHEVADNTVLTQTSSQTGSMMDFIGQPKVLDFGIARVTDADLQTVTVQTEFGQLVGTLAYMSPEQVSGHSDDLDTRCDVYALGVMLYELLARKRPHDLTGLPVTEAARVIREVDPEPIGAIDRKLRGDVETIVAKAIEKERSRRYASAAQFAADIRRCLSFQPIEARPASTFYQLGRFARRNKGLVAGICIAFLTLVAGVIGIGVALVEARHQRDVAHAANDRLTSVVEYQSAMLKELDVEEMGRQIVSDLRTEARASLNEAGDAVAPQVEAFEQVLSRINATTVANRALDVSIMSRAVTALDDGFSDQPDLSAELRSNLAEIYDDIGLPEKSLHQARVEWETRRQVADDNDPDTLAVKQRICELQLKLGLYEEAEQTARELIEVQQRVLGDDHLATLVSRRLLGIVLLKLTRPDEAESELLATLERLERTVGPKHVASLATRSELASCYLQKRSLDKTLEVYESVLADYESQLGPDHPDTLAVLRNIAQTLFLGKKYEQALPYFERIRNTMATQKGGDHPDTLTAQLALADDLAEMTRYDDAEPIVTDTLERCRRVLGTDHPSTILALSSGMRVMTRLKRWNVAEKYGIEALSIAQRTLGPDNIRTLDARNDLVFVYLKSENHEAALPLGKEAVAEYQRVLGPDHRRTLIMQQSYAKALMSAGKLEDAASELDVVVRICREKFADTSTLAGALGQSVSTLVNLDRGADAEPLARELLAWCENKSTNDATLGRCHLWIARSLYSQARLDESEQSINKAIELMTGNVDKEFWPLLYAHFMKDVIAVRRGATDRENEIIATFRRIDAMRDKMFPEDRNTILPEISKLLSDIGVTITDEPN
ncbi:MAG TPA: serine/threonine-protein kinase [Phycisphaerae bacterium]|nr:serine/threonine-protein kinase [Phycisphaerae bacterium]